MYTAIARNRRYTVLLFVLFGVIVVGVSVWLSVLAEHPWPGIFIIVFTGLFTWVQVATAVRSVGKLAGCREVTREQEPELHRAVETLAIRTGMPTPKVCVIEDDGANALAVGTGPKNSLIAVSRGALNILDRNQLEGVVAHEMAHIQNLDTRVKVTIFALVGSFAALTAACWGVALFMFTAGRGSKNSPAAFGVPFAVLAGIFGLIAFVAGPLVRAALSREREYLADASAFEMTRYADGLSSALLKMEDAGAVMRKPGFATNSFFFLTPLKRGFWAKLVSSHPTTLDRVERLRAISRSF